MPLGVDGYKTHWKAAEVTTTIYRLEAEALAGPYHLDIALQDRANDRWIPVLTTGESATTELRIENIQDKIVVRIAD
jgi:hypothetical protein